MDDNGVILVTNPQTHEYTEAIKTHCATALSVITWKHI